MILVVHILGSEGIIATSAGTTEKTPYVTSMATPTSVTIPECHRLAMEFVSRQYNVPMDQLITGTYIWYENGEWYSNWKEEWIEFPSIHKRVCMVNVDVKGSDISYGVNVDEKGEIVDLEEIRAQEEEAYRTRCGKFDPALCERLLVLAEDELVEVAIWLKDIDVAAIYDEVAKNYPPG
jgi:hypothetical protein